MKETVQSRHLAAKSNLSTLIKVLSAQSVIKDEVEIMMLTEVNKIEDNPYSLLQDVEGQDIEIQHGASGAKEKWKLTRTPI